MSTILEALERERETLQTLPPKRAPQPPAPIRERKSGGSNALIWIAFLALSATFGAFVYFAQAKYQEFTSLVISERSAVNARVSVFEDQMDQYRASFDSFHTRLDTLASRTDYLEEGFAHQKDAITQQLEKQSQAFDADRKAVALLRDQIAQLTERLNQLEAKGGKIERTSESVQKLESMLPYPADHHSKASELLAG